MNEAVKWYDQKRPGLGDEFFQAVQRNFNKILEHPKQYPVERKDVRVALVERFPYAVFFRLRGEAVVVISVFHGARDPAEWQSRS